MAEFQEVMRQWKRMCDAYTTDDAASCCKGCPMSGRGCGAIYESGNADPDVIERETMSWAADHPEPVYPTWEEYFIAKGLLLPNWNSLGMPPYDMYKYAERALSNHISADIAQKLGIEPKEG